MDKLWQDLRGGFRILRKAPGFSVLIIFIVAIGVGSSATIFSLVETALLWKENPNVDRWVAIRAFFPQQNLRVTRFSPAEFDDFKALTDVFERVGAVTGFTATIFVDHTPEAIHGAFVSADTMPMTATAPLMGRVFTPDDDKPGAPKTLVMTYETWQNRFSGDPNILGRDIRVDNDHYTVIGVMPPHYGLWGGEVYLPFQLGGAESDRSHRRLWVDALIRKGLTVRQVDARLAEFARTWERGHVATNPEYQGVRLNTWNIKEAVIGGVRPALLILTGVVGLIVLISCANIANLLLARASSRRREMSIRAALGAPRRRLVRQLLTESLVLSLAGGAAGALVAAWGVSAAVGLIGIGQLPGPEPRLDTGALLLALAVSTTMGILFGLAPAVFSARGDLARAVREGGLQAGGGREGCWARSALVISQIALAMVVLAGAGLMIRSYRELSRLDIGYNAHDVLTMQLAAPAETYPTPATITAFYRELLERLRRAHGIEAAAVATGRPMMDRQPDIATQDFSLPGYEGGRNVPNANLRIVSPGYFETAGVHLLSGRLLNESDTARSEPVAVINKTMATLYWPAQEAVGHSIRLGSHYGLELDASTGRWVTIVGVVADARQVQWIDIPVRQELFFPLAQRAEMARAVTLVVRSPLPTDALTDVVRRTVLSIDPERPIFNVETLDKAVSDSFATQRLATVLLGLFAATAITLASVGLYGLMAFAVAQNTRDIGIRMALGARPRDVLRMTIRDGWRLTMAGLVVGMAGALAATRMMRSLVFDVSTTDPATFATTGVLLAAIALLASYIPAHRATRIDPIIALRCE
jgi:putative ABC transport system permease protein